MVRPSRDAVKKSLGGQTPRCSANGLTRHGAMAAEQSRAGRAEEGEQSRQSSVGRAEQRQQTATALDKEKQQFQMPFMMTPPRNLTGPRTG
jgi:hypothetical protein